MSIEVAFRLRARNTRAAELELGWIAYCIPTKDVSAGATHAARIVCDAGDVSTSEVGF
jgi:hypothetical protein